MNGNLSVRDAHALDEFHQDLINAVNDADSGTAFCASIMMAYLDVAQQLDPGGYENYIRVVMRFVKKRFPETWPEKIHVVETMWKAVISANLSPN